MAGTSPAVTNVETRGAARRVDLLKAQSPAFAISNSRTAALRLRLTHPTHRTVDLFRPVMPGSRRASTSFLPPARKQDVDGRDEPGHDD